SVMSSSSTVTYTSVYMDSEPGRPVAPPSPDYVPDPEYLPAPIEPYVVADSPIALSLGYIADSDLEEDSENGPVDYPADGGDDDDEPSDDDDDDDDDDDEEPFEDKDDDDEEEHLAPADSFAVLVVDPIPSAEDTEALETEVERLLALPTPPPSPVTPLSSPLPPLLASLSIPPPRAHHRHPLRQQDNLRDHSQSPPRDLRDGGATGYIGSPSYPYTMTRGDPPSYSSSSDPQKTLPGSESM
nr:hypothetical protein [Tanacetum cinerariifolium]